MMDGGGGGGRLRDPYLSAHSKGRGKKERRVRERVECRGSSRIWDERKVWRR